MNDPLSPAQPSQNQRQDAQRNAQRVLDAALDLLAVDPQAGIDEIATKAGVGRATLYRHFPTREKLIDALRERARADVSEAITASNLEEGAAREALDRLITGLVEVGTRYLFLVQFFVPGRRAKRAEMIVPLVKLIERGQASGEFTNDAPAHWWIEVLKAVIVCASRATADGSLPREEIVIAAKRTVMRGLCPRARAREERSRGT